MSSFIKKQAELVSFLIFGWLAECDQPKWGPASEGVLCLKTWNTTKTHKK